MDNNKTIFNLVWNWSADSSLFNSFLQFLHKKCYCVVASEMD